MAMTIVCVIWNKKKQGSSSAITWPVDFVTTMTIDGLVINLVNIWRKYDISSGDDLMLYLKNATFTEYVLSHHSKNNRMQRFPMLKKWPQSVQQKDGSFKNTDVLEPIMQLFPGVCSDDDEYVQSAIWKAGYWHIARSQTMHFKYDSYVDIPNGTHAAVKGNLLKVTFQPVWVDALESGGTHTASHSSGGEEESVKKKKQRLHGSSHEPISFEHEPSGRAETRPAVSPTI